MEAKTKTHLTAKTILSRKYLLNKQFFNLKLFKLKRSILLHNNFRAQGFVRLKKTSLHFYKKLNYFNYMSNPNKSGFINPILGLKLNLKNEFYLDSSFITFKNNISFCHNKNTNSYLINDFFIYNYVNINNRVVPSDNMYVSNTTTSLYLFKLLKLKNITDMLIILKS